MGALGKLFLQRRLFDDRSHFAISKALFLVTPVGQITNTHTE